jgi:flagellar protein FliO/FliZ
MLSLGTREKIILLEVGEEQIVIGTSAQGIQHLHTLIKPIKVEDASNKTSVSFSEQFKKLLQSPQAKKESKDIGQNNEE